MRFSSIFLIINLTKKVESETFRLKIIIRTAAVAYLKYVSNLDLVYVGLQYYM